MGPREARTVLVVDDDGDLRLLVRETLALHPGLEVVAEAASGQAALDAVRTHDPDMVVLDLGLPDMQGHDLLTHLRELSAQLRVVVFTGSATITDPALRALPADGLVQKGGDLRRLVQTLEHVASGDGPMVAALDLDHSTHSPPEARRFVQTTLSDWNCDQLVDDALLVVSELVTNAVTHASSSAHLELRLLPQALRIEVADHGGGAPEPQSIDVERPSGRGLLLVSAMAVAWGIDPVADGKVVWAELAV